MSGCLSELWPCSSLEPSHWTLSGISTIPFRGEKVSSRSEAWGKSEYMLGSELMMAIHRRSRMDMWHWRYTQWSSLDVSTSVVDFEASVSI